MNRLFKSLAVVATVFMLIPAFISCSKDSDNNVEPGLSPKIQSIIADSLVKDLEAKGMTIHKGNTPPNIEGVFHMAPKELIRNYGPEDSYKEGIIINSYKYTFYDQVGDEAKIDYTSYNGADVAKGLGTLISGSGNKFTLFAEVKSESNGIKNTSVSIFSGEMTEDGIKYLQEALLLTSKEGDEKNYLLMPIGKSRLYIDQDKISPREKEGQKKAFQSSSIEALDLPASGQARE